MALSIYRHEWLTKVHKKRPKSQTDSQKCMVRLFTGKFEAAVRFYKSTGAQQRLQVDKKCLPLPTDQF